MSTFVSLAAGEQPPVSVVPGEGVPLTHPHRHGMSTPLPVATLAIAVADVTVAIGVAAVIAPRGAVLAPGTAAAGLLWMVVLAAVGGFERPPGAAISPRLASVARAGFALGLTCWVASSYLDIDIEPQRLLTGTLILVLAAVTTRLLDSLAVRRSAAAGVPLLVAGDPAMVGVGLRILERTARGAWRVVGARVSEPTAELADVQVPVSVGTEDLRAAAQQVGAQAVLLLPGPGLDPTHVRRIAWQLEGGPLKLYVAAGLLDAAPAHLRVTTLGDLDAVQVQRPVLYRPAWWVKTVTERVIAAALLLLLLPLLLGVAVAVRSDSPGPAVFRQRRVGRDGREFTMWKFRTMVQDAESALAAIADRNEADGALFKIRKDPRITRLGGVLRRYSLDELPQLVNVVCGEMALIGPRPALPCEVADYGDDPRRRLAVRPGMTGLWQVSGRSDLSWEESVRLDLHYVDHWSLRLDLLIACRTVGAVLGHRGAY